MDGLPSQTNCALMTDPNRSRQVRSRDGHTFDNDEGILDWGAFHAEILKTPIRWEDGYVIPPTPPRLGVELDAEFAAVIRTRTTSCT
jgi:L-alanine-DL-glutamate epimerase-like enolase superfamily enzyme